MKQNLITRTILTLVMLVTSVTVLGQEDEIDGLHYFFYDENHTASVGCGICQTLTGNVVVPSEIIYKGIKYTVTSVSNTGFSNSNVENVKLPSTITKISSYAFRNCKELKSIDLANSVKSIGASAFYNCEKLISITGLESVEFIDIYAFRNVPWLDEQPDGVVYIGKVLYRYNGSMPSNTSINVKEGIVQIADDAFRNYSSLVSVSLPNSVTTIGSYAFNKCINLAYTSIPQSVVKIGVKAFTDTKWLDGQPDGVVYINNIAYTYKGYMPEGTSINIKNGTTTIAEYAFQQEKNLTSVTIPNSVTYIGTSAFKSCSGLTSINIPSSVTEISENAFNGSGLVSVILPNSIKNIYIATFENCQNLKKVMLPQSIMCIDIWGFQNCHSLEEMTCLSTTVPKTSESTFSAGNIKNAILFVPASALEAYRNTAPWSNFGTIKAVEEQADAVAPTISNKTVTVKNVEYGSIELSWNKATDNFTSQEELMYSVYVNGELFKQDRGMTSCIVTDLKPSTKYTFEVRVEDLRGNVSKYNIVQATTEAKPVVIEKYPVLIEYTQITSENATDFWGDGGSIKYDPATKTLTLAWADLSSDDDAICIYDDITIKLIGQNTVKGSIYADYTGELTFTGDGSLSVKGEYPLNGWLSALVLKDGCTVELDATGYDSPGLGLDDCLLGVDHSTLKVKGGKGNRSIRAVTTFWMEGSEFESNHSYDKANYMFLDATGKEATDEIIIAPIIKKIPMIADNSITIVNVDDTSATVAWMAATDDTTPQSELQYYVYSMQYNDFDFSYDTTLNGTTSYTFTNLKPGTEYYVRIKVVDKDDNQVFYQDASFTTTTPDTSAPALGDNEIRVTDVTENSIAIEWTKASDDRTADDQLVYEVVYADNSSFADNYLMVQVDKNTATLRKLSPSTTYYIKVSVSDEASNRSEYRVLSVKTVSSATAISTIAADDNSNSIMYNTSGIRVDKSFRGIVIKNGQKMMVK